MRRLREGPVIYEVYVRSFQDSNGDGVGDIPGVTSRLDYCEQLGVDYVWLTPFYPSPMRDFGYDVESYTDVHSLFGILSDVVNLIDEACRRDIGIIIDAVFDHTSDRHPWFVESRSSRTNPKRQYYIWADPAPDGGPPNNWISVFGGSAWEFDAQTGQYYLHSFLKEMPDLNWEDPEVQEELKEILRFWFGLGVMGIRVDAWDWVGKDVWNFTDDPPDPAYDPSRDHDPYHRLIHRYSTRMSHLARYLRVLESVALEFEGRFIVTETYPPGRESPGSEYRTMLNQYTPGLSAPFIFGLMWLPEFTAQEVGRFIDQVQGVLRKGEILIYVMGTHDSPRLASRIGSQAARLAAMLHLTLPGISVVYAGDELGLVNGVIRPDQVRDPAAKQHPDLGRDPGRTPILWTVGEHAGFTTGTPWLPITQPSSMSVESELENSRSDLHLYRRLIALRRQWGSLSSCDFEALHLHPNVYGYRDRRFAVLLNFSSSEVAFTTSLERGELLLSSELDEPSRVVSLREVRLRGWEGWLVRLIE